MNAETNVEPLEVKLRIPCRAEYVGVARLAVLGVASRLNFDFDEVEDLRLAVGEACSGAIDCANEAPASCGIELEFDILPQRLDVMVRFRCCKAAEQQSAEQGDSESISALLMEILVDSVDISTDENGVTTVLLSKNVKEP